MTDYRSITTKLSTLAMAARERIGHIEGMSMTHLSEPDQIAQRNKLVSSLATANAKSTAYELRQIVSELQEFISKNETL